MRTSIGGSRWEYVDGSGQRIIVAQSGTLASSFTYSSPPVGVAFDSVLEPVVTFVLVFVAIAVSSTMRTQQEVTLTRGQSTIAFRN